MLFSILKKKIRYLKTNNIFFYDSFKFWQKYIFRYPKNYKLIISISKLFLLNLKELYFHFSTNFKFMKFYHPYKLKGYSENKLSGSRPTSYSLAVKIINKNDKINIEKNFLDIGSGNGMILYLANKKKFNLIYGVEKSSKVLNLTKKLNFFKNKNIKLENIDFFDYEIPVDVNLIYFYSPIKSTNIKTYKIFFDKIIKFSKKKKDLYIISNKFYLLKFSGNDFKIFYSYKDNYIRDHKFIILKKK